MNTLQLGLFPLLDMDLGKIALKAVSSFGKDKM